MNTQAKIELAIVLARRCKASPSMIAQAVARMSRNASALQRLHEAECNGDAIGPTYDRARKGVERIELALADLGVSASLVENGDPRGYPVFLVFAGEDVRSYSNDLGQRGYGIGGQ